MISMKWRKMMKKHIITEMILVIAFIGVCFWNVRQQQDVVFFRETVAALKEKQKDYKEKKQQLIFENERLSDEIMDTSKSLKEIHEKSVNDETNVDSNSEFINIVTKLFKANLNFTPENYEERKKEVSSYLSDDLSEEYFGQKRNTYQDSKKTFTKLVTLELFPKYQKNKEIEGLVIAHYESKQSDQNWTEAMNIFKVKYSGEIKKVTNIINLGSGY